MDRIVSIVMYCLWVLTIIFILSTTFTDFKYDDLNILAVLFLVFASLNSFFVLNRRRHRAKS